MNTLLVFLVRRDQTAQLVVYVLLGLVVIALEIGSPGSPRLAGSSDRAHVAACEADAVLPR